MLTKGRFFDSHYQIFEYNPAWDSFNKFIEPNFLYYPPSKKDWEDEYKELEKTYNLLKSLDVDSYPQIKIQIIELYKKSFNYMLPNLKYNYKDIDERLDISFFNGLLEKLYLTEN